MKNFIILVLLGIVFHSHVQETEVTDFNKNEVKLNVFYLILGAAEVSYERNLNEESSLGISFFIPISEEVFWDVNYLITPYYRIFFGNKPAQGFFFEGFGMLNSTKQNTYYYIETPTNYYYKEEVTNHTDFALGVAVGGKFVLKEKLVAEVSGGIGRNLFQNNEYDYFSNVPRFNIGIGYRF